MALITGLHTFVLFFGFFWSASGISSAGLPDSVSTSPPTCLGDLVFLNNDDNQQRHCNPDKFIEIEFKLKFGCISPAVEYLIDQGIRLEVGIEGVTEWTPIRFYASNLTIPTSYSSLVTLDPQNKSVTAKSLRYDSSLPMKLLEVGKTHVIREYLCGDLANMLANGSESLRVRWMQRFGVRANRNEAPWMLDDVIIKLWNGSCYMEVVSEDFEEPIEKDEGDIRNGELDVPFCGAPGNGSALYFRNAVTSTSSTRRSLIFKLHGQELQQCDGVSTAGNSGHLSCPVEAESHSKARITCSANSFVTCSCGEGVAINNTRCTVVPTTVEATTMATSTKTATMAVDTFTEPATLSPVVLSETLDVLEKGVTEEAIGDVVSLFPPGGVPKEVTEVVISATAKSLKTASVDSDPSAGGRILNSLDLFALQGYNASFGEVENELYSFGVEDFEEEDLLELDGATEIEGIHNALGGIDIPGELFLEIASTFDSIRMASFIYKNLSGVLPANTENGTNATIGSPVVSATLGCGSATCTTGNLTLEHPVVVKIHHFKSVEDEDTLQCQFFDLEKNEWSTRGCKRNTEYSNSTYSYCECKHLTHFAILLSPGITISGDHAFSLEIIGYVGVSISVVCMVATIFILTFLKPLRGMRTYIHVNLCICLSVSQLFFIVAVDKTSIAGVCQAIAIILHYMFLVTFMWMLMEGVVLYVVLIRVFIKKQKRYILGFTLVSYGLPALYLCLTVPLGMALRDSEGRPQYGSSEVSDTCWLRYDTHFVWAFIAPVIIIIFINCGFFVMAISIMCKHEKRRTDKSKLESISNWLKTSISLAVVMGITWIIGVLVFNEALLFVAYIFTIVTAFQGSIIFLLFVVFSKQVRDHYGSWWKSKKSESEVLSKLFPSSTDSKNGRSSFFSRTGTRTSSTFFSRSMTFRSALPDDDTDVKLTDIKEQTSNGQSVQQAKWIVDLKPSEDSIMEDKEEDKQRESEYSTSVPVGQLEFSASSEGHNSHKDVDAGDGRYVAITMCDKSNGPNLNSVGGNVVASGRSPSEAEMGLVSADIDSTEGHKPNGTVVDSADHMTQCGNEKSTNAGGSVNLVEDVDSHLADTS